MDQTMDRTMGLDRTTGLERTTGLDLNFTQIVLWHVISRQISVSALLQDATC